MPRQTQSQRPIAKASRTVVFFRRASEVRGLRLRLARIGIASLCLPPFHMRLNDNADSRASLRQVGTFNALIFTSPNAVRACFRLHPGLQIPKRVKVYAPGLGTQKTLLRHGVVQAQAPAHRASIDALLRWPSFQTRSSDAIAVITAPDGRADFFEAMRTRIARVTRVDVYRRVPVPYRIETMQRLRALKPSNAILVATSQAALKQGMAGMTFDLSKRLLQSPIVVSSDRVARVAQELGFGQQILAASALADDLIDTLQQLVRDLSAANTR